MIKTNRPEDIPDQNTDIRLLPEAFIPRDNANQRRRYQIALREALAHCLSPEKRSLVEMHYLQGKKKREIARELGMSDSSVCRGIQAAEEVLRSYLTFYQRVDKLVENDTTQTNQEQRGGRL